MKSIELVGAPWGFGALDPGCQDGPDVLRRLDLMACLHPAGLHPVWGPFIRPEPADGTGAEAIAALCTRLARYCRALTEEGQPFTVLGGDHSCAIGTWSGAALATEGPLGLLWIDAHMDAHTPQTTHTGAIHGMPVAALLGHGDPRLTGIGGGKPKIDPANLCILGVRSFEPEEPRLLARLGVRVFAMDEIRRRGLTAVLADALAIVTRDTQRFGVSIDLDAIDPQDAPGVGTPAPGGIRGAELVSALRRLRDHPGLVGMEVAEFNPHRDRHQRTARLTCELVAATLGTEKGVEHASTR